MVTTIRPRTPEDADACADVARLVYERDAYPVVLPDDLRGFIVAPFAIGAWVAEDDGDVVGHVALHPSGSPEVLALASGALGEPPGRLALVARLFVSLRRRRRGIAAALLTTASDAARSLGRVAILDVATHFAAAISLYEAHGWSRLGMVTVDIGTPELLDEFVFAAPRVSEPGTC